MGEVSTKLSLSNMKDGVGTLQENMHPLVCQLSW